MFEHFIKFAQHIKHNIKNTSFITNKFSSSELSSCHFIEILKGIIEIFLLINNVFLDQLQFSYLSFIKIIVIKQYPVDAEGVVLRIH